MLKCKINEGEIGICGASFSVWILAKPTVNNLYLAIPHLPCLHLLRLHLWIAKVVVQALKLLCNALIEVKQPKAGELQL